MHRWWVPLEADFQRHYGIDLSDVWTDDLSPRRFKVLFRGLMRMPDSITRQQVREELDPTNQPQPAPSGPPQQSSLSDIQRFLGR